MLHPTVSDSVFLTMNSSESMSEQITRDDDLTNLIKFMYNPKTKHDNNNIILTHIEMLPNFREGMEQAVKDIKELIIGEIDKPSILGFSEKNKPK